MLAPWSCSWRFCAGRSHPDWAEGYPTFLPFLAPRAEPGPASGTGAQAKDSDLPLCFPGNKVTQNQHTGYDCLGHKT